MGNAIYIVDPEDGSLLLSISGSGSGADIQVPDMHYSIPAAVRSLDSDGDGVADRLYVGDTGGQVWRVDLAILETTDPNPESTTVVGKLAEIADSSSDSKQRRFFDAPSVVQVRDTLFSNESNYDYVLVGSGYRPHPLNTDVEDRFYAFRDFFTGANEMTAAVGNVADTTDGYPQIDGSAYDNDDLTVIRFPNRQVPSQNFRFVIISNQNNTTHEMVNLGFYSRKKHTPQEAKRILGDINKSQLKLDLDFNDRINIEGVVPK